MRGLLLILLALCAPLSAVACGRDSDCPVADGSYRIALPEGWTGGPALLHLHGWGASSASVMGNGGFLGPILARGYAVIAPLGLRWQGGDGPRDWSVADGTPPRRDEAAFFGAVLADAATRHGVAEDRVLMTGFSRGGSMVWDIACRRPGLAPAYAPIAGGFWKPLPEACAGPARLFHTHGFADSVVPLEGRRIPIESPEITQGDIHAGLALLRGAAGCPPNAAGHEIGAVLWQKRWACEAGALTLALHAGGHVVPKGWAAAALDWFEALPD